MCAGEGGSREKRRRRGAFLKHGTTHCEAVVGMFVIAVTTVVIVVAKAAASFVATPFFLRAVWLCVCSEDNMLRF